MFYFQIGYFSLAYVEEIDNATGCDLPGHRRILKFESHFCDTKYRLTVPLNHKQPHIASYFRLDFVI